MGYEPIVIATDWGFTDFCICPDCGALVRDEAHHTRWHATLQVIPQSPGMEDYHD